MCGILERKELRSKPQSVTLCGRRCMRAACSLIRAGSEQPADTTDTKIQITCCRCWLAASKFLYVCAAEIRQNGALHSFFFHFVFVFLSAFSSEHFLSTCSSGRGFFLTYFLSLCRALMKCNLKNCARQIVGLLKSARCRHR